MRENTTTNFIKVFCVFRGIMYAKAKVSMKINHSITYMLACNGMIYFM